jgi:hypothetical protein
MLARSLVPALLSACASVASAQATTPATEASAEPDAAASAGAAAAAAPAASAAPKTAAAPVQRCHREYPTGSNLPKTVCETQMPSDLDQMRERALDDLKHKVTPGLRVIGS